MDKVKKATPKQVQTVKVYLTAMQDCYESLFLALRKTEYMSSSFVKKDLTPRMRELILQTGELIQISQWENNS